MVIDVRSPSEFGEDHVPGAVNLPVLNDAERARVGTVYKQLSPFEARRMGAALVARNIAAAIEGPLNAQPPGFSALVYCWRGGMRSNAFAHVAAQVGWRIRVVEGGYKAYRAHVRRILYEAPLASRFVVLDGDTGSGKTAILEAARAQGAAVLDLEGLARHRGSALGHFNADPQPTQKRFESDLYDALRNTDPDSPVLVEAESNKLGARVIPASVWTAMQAAPRIRLDVPVAERARHSVAAYADIAADPDAIAARLQPLIPIHGRETVERWRGLAEAGALEAFARALIEEHYDPAYARARARGASGGGTRLVVTRLDAAGIDAAAAEATALALSLDAARCEA
jgi:tRNA 2-selenouridine synthase